MQLRRTHSETKKPHQTKKQALIIAGDSLTKMEASLEFMDLFLEICDKMDAVLACRVSPKQKGDIVSLV